MTSAALSLVPEGFSTHNLSTVDSLNNPASHLGHGCCLDDVRMHRSLVGVDPENLRAIVIPLRCRSWRCVCCTPRLLRRNRARAVRGATVGGSHRVWMLTLTIDPTDERWIKHVDGMVEHGHVREAGGRALPLRGEDTTRATARLSLTYSAMAWNRLRTYLKRETGLEGVSFYVGKELHKSGMAHLHVLVRRPGTSPWLMKYDRLWTLANRAGFGRIDVQVAVSRRDVARYVSKSAGMSPAGQTFAPGGYSGQASGIVAAYTSKNAQSLPRWTRRGSWSRDWCAWAPATRIAGFTWRLGGASAAFIADGYRDDGWRVEDPSRYRVPAVSAGGG